jgi:simple sugar transport system permease protein
MDIDLMLGLLKLALITATPLALGAYAGIMCERAGVVNIAIEGMMLTSAMTAQLVTMYASVPILAAYGSPAIGSRRPNRRK